MLAFFRINDPYRLIGVFLLIILIRLPFFLGEMPLTIPELQWMLVGESVSLSHILYLDVWDDIGPLSAMVYSLIDTIGGRTQWGYQMLAALILLLQCYLFNQLLISNKAYNENTYIPALIYMILMGSFFDFFTLSPVLMSCTFQLLVINGIFHHIAVKARDEQFLNIGLALGLSALLYLPTLAYFPISILALGLFSSMTFKKYILLFFGFLFPMVLVGIYFFWHGALLNFIESYFFAWMNLPFTEMVSLRTMLLISAASLVLLVLSWLKIYSKGRYNNHQTNFIQVMVLFLVGSGIMIFLSRERVPHQLMIFAAPMAFFLSHYFLLIRRKLLAELVFIGFLAVSITVNYGVLYRFAIPTGIFNIEQLIVQPTPWDELVSGKKLLIVGNEPDAYLHAYPVTPYLNWNLSKEHLERINAFDNLSMIYNNLRNDLPEIIIDQQNLVPGLFNHMPTVASLYQKQGNAYLLKSSN
ncbi:MAG: hypothetical protein DHS20C17_04010 [Cyclobacteriaceae bacterium]|nr:MAG: hypothetical protein DHS20C17_04010 [Cyclobacteriaceae bacterium]